MRTQMSQDDPRVQAALAELQERLEAQYPEATFAVCEGDDPEGLYLTITVDVEDTDEVMDVVLDRLLELQIDEGLPIYVMPVLPLSRVEQQLQAQSRTQATSVPYLYQG